MVGVVADRNRDTRSSDLIEVRGVFLVAASDIKAKVLGYLGSS